MVKGTIYKKSNGQVVMTCQGPDEKNVELQCILDPDYAAYVGEEIDGDKFYFKDGKPVPRTPLPITIEPRRPDSVESEMKLGKGELLRVTGIPDGTRLIAPGQIDFIVDDGFFEWETDIQGTYNFTLYKDQSYTGVTFNAIVG
jgi:hypothetical protein